MRDIRIVCPAVMALAVLGAAGHVAAAQATTLPSAPSQTPAADTTSPFHVNGQLLTSGDRRYQVTVTAHGQPHAMGTRDVIRSASTYGPTPSWVLIASGGRGVLESTDTLALSRATLQPLNWNATLGTARLAIAFAQDTIYGAVSSPVGQHNFVLPNPGRLVVSAEMLDALLELEPLTAGWRDSVSMLIVDPSGAVTVPLTLSVRGEAAVRVPAGSYDCWVVDVDGARAASRVWVSKAGHVVVREVQALSDVDGTLDRLLLGVSPAAPMPTQPGPAPGPHRTADR